VPVLEHQLDTLAANAMPAQFVHRAGGWLLRAAPDYPFRRCNSVLAIGGDPIPAGDDAFELVESFYETVERRARYQVSPASCPSDLDARLAHRGYEVEAPVDILVAVIAGVARSSMVNVRRAIDPAWAGVLGDRVRAYAQLLRAVAFPSIVVTAGDDPTSPAAIALGVIERGWLGVFGMQTRPEYRGRGIATELLDTLLAVGAEMGATRSYLQLEVDNEHALRLYERRGFARVYGYHYRTQPLPAVTP
jgi:GNAT superfamily N-acetyltransferase